MEQEAEDDARRAAPAVPPWGHCFRRTGSDEPAVIELTQIDAKLFHLESSLTYVGPTTVALPAGLAAWEVGPRSLPTSDLTSVPGPLRWFVSPYGLHTPAALVHDRLVGAEAPAGFHRRDADRLFRDMLDALGVPLLRRWLMWTAVAYGTRWSAGGLRRVGIVVWTVLAVIGMVSLVHRPGHVRPAVAARRRGPPLPRRPAVGSPVRRRAARRRQRAVAGRPRRRRGPRLRRLLGHRAR